MSKYFADDDEFEYDEFEYSGDEVESSADAKYFSDDDEFEYSGDEVESAADEEDEEECGPSRWTCTDDEAEVLVAEGIERAEDELDSFVREKGPSNELQAQIADLYRNTFFDSEAAALTTHALRFETDAGCHFEKPRVVVSPPGIRELLNALFKACKVGLSALLLGAFLSVPA